jgi:serine protease inhibitor
MSQRNRAWAVPVVAGALSIAAALSACGGGDSAESPAPPVISVPPADTAPPGGSGVSTPAAVLQAKQDSTPVDPAIVTADNTFGLNLLNTLVPLNAGNNTTISPISVAMTLQIVYNGAVGPTQTTMAQTLQLGAMSVQQLNTDNANLLGALLDPDPQVDLTIANSLWVPLGTNTVSPAFITADQTYYGAEIGDVAGAPANVNAWVSAETNGLITDLLPPGDYVTALANTVYFKGQWTSGFSPAQTVTAPFTLADGTQVSVPMMQQSNTFPYFQGTNFQAVNLPYGSGRLSMLVVLPDAGVDPGSFVAAITPAAVESWVSGMYTEMVNLGLPRFTTAYSTSLQAPLTTLGMGDAFDSGENGFTGIFPSFYISVVEHKTYVQVDETGTVAAAATGVGETSVAQASVNLQLDRPFFYAIRDNQTGELLFVGVLMNPNGG